ncbi:MAG: hypothetical protein GDA41_10135 [Rhodospirillales bacterium]|nr:hypothetical protein [Rhodospirillales bacterium]
MQKKIETCYLHIGLSKTGTTSLQRALAHSRGKLSKNGILYPYIGRYRTHNFIVRGLVNMPNFGLTQTSHPLSIGVRRKQTLNFQRQMNARRSEICRIIEKEIEAFPGDVMIVSAELFDRLLDREDCRRVLEYFRKYCNNIKICVYIRNPLDFMVSLIREFIDKSSKTIENMESLEGINTVPLNKERLSGWIDAVGLENMLTIPYDRQRLIGRSTVTDFLARTGIDGALVEIPPEEYNPSLTMNGMFVKNEMNKRAGSKGYRRLEAPYLLSLPGPRFLPSKRFADAMHKRCREDLAWLSATFAIDLAPIDLANGSGGHRGPWQDYFTDEVKTVLKDMLDRGRSFGSAIEEQAFREVGEGILSGRIFAS